MRPPPESADPGQTFEIDTSVAHAARVYDYLLGGTDHFAVDRAAAESAAKVHPGGIATSRAMVRANRAFLVRAVRYLAGEIGVRQFLDIGTGIPNADNVHAVAQQVAPDAKVVCVDNDPVVLAHAHVLLQSTPEGDATFLRADLRDPENVLQQASALLDLRQPVAVLLVAILHLLRDEDDPHALPTRLMAAVPSGSYLVLSHLTGELAPEMAEVSRRYESTMHEPLVLRTRAEVSRFFDGLELVGPGVVSVDRWRPDESDGSTDTSLVAHWAGVARKP